MGNGLCLLPLLTDEDEGAGVAVVRIPSLIRKGWAMACAASYCSRMGMEAWPWSYSLPLFGRDGQWPLPPPTAPEWGWRRCHGPTPFPCSEGMGNGLCHLPLLPDEDGGPTRSRGALYKVRDWGPLPTLLLNRKGRMGAPGRPLRGSREALTLTHSLTQYHP